VSNRKQTSRQNKRNPASPGNGPEPVQLPTAADALTVIYRTAVPERGGYFDDFGLASFRNEYGDRIEQLASAPRLPWFRFIKRWQTALVRRRLRSDIALTLAIHRDIAIGMQDAAGRRDRPSEPEPPQLHSFEDDYYFRRALEGYPRYGYMSPPTD
jgi:hypothetical protein